MTALPAYYLEPDEPESEGDELEGIVREEDALPNLHQHATDPRSTPTAWNPHLPSITRGTAHEQSNALLASMQALKAEDLLPPREFTPPQQQMWNDMISMKPLGEWSRSDRPFLIAYVKAWTDIDDIQTRLDLDGFVVAGKPNPLLRALNSRMLHMERMRVNLGLGRRALDDSGSVTARTKGGQRAAAGAAVLRQEQGDALLASP